DSDPERSVERGRTAYTAGRFDEALEAFLDAVAKAPGNPIPLYGAAAARYQLGQFDEALRFYLRAAEYAGPGLRTRIDFALGNTALRLGEVAEAIAHYDAALASTATDPGLDRIREDAAINRNYAVQQARAIEPPEGLADKAP